jgi:hypothetical protein
MTKTNMTHTRTFGCEIELVGLTIEAAARALRASGINTFDTETNSFDGVTPDYDDDGCDCSSCRGNRADPNDPRMRTAWKVTYDGSVSNGCEVVSPILSGSEGLESVRKVVRALKAAGARVDNSCGFHVHVNARDLQGPELINAVRRYAQHETTIDSFMAPRRRESRSEWCRSMVELSRTLSGRGDLFVATNVANLPQTRYYKLNLAAYVKHGTLEFRQHAGTLNLNKMINWIMFCVQFVEDSRLPQSYLDNYKTLAEQKKLVKAAQVLARLPRPGVGYGRESWTLSRELGVYETEIDTLINKVRERFPVYNAVYKQGGRYRIRTTIPADQIPSDCDGSLEQPPASGIFDNLPSSTVAYLLGRAENYRTASRTGRA